MAPETIEAWHFLREDRRLNYPPHTKVAVGETLRIDGGPELCARGFHASVIAQDGLSYAPGTREVWICRVVVGGTIRHDTTKLVGTERTVLWMAPARPTLVRWACWCATGALLGRVTRGRGVDPRSWQALVAAERFLVGEIGEDEIRAAADAAAAAYAAYAAAVAAYAASAAAYAYAAYAYAAYAASAAAYAYAAYAAADAAAARAQARSLMAQELERRLWKLAP